MTAGSYGKKIFSFLRNHQTVFQSSYTILHSYQKQMRVPVVPYHCSQLVASVLQISHYHSNKCVVVPSCFKLHFLDDIICLFTICYLPPVYHLWWGYLSKSLAYFLTGLFAFFLLSLKSSSFITDNKYCEYYQTLWIFSPSLFYLSTNIFELFRMLTIYQTSFNALYYINSPTLYNNL